MKCDLWGSLDLITSKRLHQTGTTISPATCKVSPPNPSPCTVQMSIFDFIRGCCWWVGGCGCYIIKTPSGKRHDKGASHGRWWWLRSLLFVHTYLLTVAEWSTSRVAVDTGRADNRFYALILRAPGYEVLRIHTDTA